MGWEGHEETRPGVRLCLVPLGNGRVHSCCVKLYLKLPRQRFLSALSGFEDRAWVSSEESGFPWDGV